MSDLLLQQIWCSFFKEKKTKVPLERNQIFHKAGRAGGLKNIGGGDKKKKIL